MNEEMNITSAQYTVNTLTNENSGITATIDGIEMSVPIAEGNRHYDEIMRQVEAGTLTIADAE
jgi:hypothetical protein